MDSLTGLCITGMMSIPESIRPRRLSDDVQDRLLALIEEEALAPGDPLPSERDLMDRYGVGRPAIREAMQSLVHLGVIDIRHGGRARLADPSLSGLVDRLAISMRHLLTHEMSSLDHLKEARLSLEVETARLAAQRRSAEDMETLRELHDTLCRTDPNADQFTALDGAFHQRIAAMTGNPIFESLVHGVFGWMRAFHEDQVRAHGKETLTLAEHESILEAIDAGDGPAAAQAMRNHLNRANALYRRDNFK